MIQRQMNDGHEGQLVDDGVVSTALLYTGNLTMNIPRVRHQNVNANLKMACPSESGSGTVFCNGE